jgi:hypothetical protein
MMAPENLGESGEVDCIFLQKLRNSDEVPRSVDPLVDRAADGQAYLATRTWATIASVGSPLLISRSGAGA